ncbi:MAG: hypothetical protein ACJASX_002702 [Limisphaerales bacterium]|jgi:hypothetical protein
MRLMRRGWISILLVCALQGGVHADPLLEAFFTQHCVECHGPEQQKGKVRLDRPIDELFAEAQLPETVVSVLEGGEMPPEDAPQPKAETRAKALELLEKRILASRPANPIKRLTRAEYANTVHDLFGVDFDFNDLLPPDQVEHGFDKFGESHLMSPHQVVAYLNTARFVAERLLPDVKPETRKWEFDARHFHGSKNFAVGGGGDYRDGDGYVLTGFRPYRSNVHFSTDPDGYERFIVPAFGVYRLEVKAHSVKSDEGEVIGINLGDGRHPTSFRNIRRIPMPQGSKGFTTELTLKAGDQLAFTFDSAHAPGRGGDPRKYKGPRMRFSNLKVTGPLTEERPATAMRAIFPKPKMKPAELVDHVALLLTGRPLPAEDRALFVEIATRRKKSGASMTSTARSVLIAQLTSPHFIYKSESPELTGVELAHRLSYFLWNSVPDAKLLAAAKSGALGRDSSGHVERMLKDAKVDRFIDDFTRQWLQRDKVDDFGPDVRVFKNVRRMTVDSMGREGRELFAHLLENDLSMVNFIDSDFVMVNDRLARFYGLPAVVGDTFVPAKLPEDSERGGLVAQAGFLKLTSTDFATSPIHRGSWILKNLYNEKIDPPADAVINEPDIRGSTTIREAMLMHQQLESCARCHSKIDPLGFALEYYDPVGRKRSEYRHVEVVNTKKVKFTEVPIDAAMTLPDGREVRDLPTLKDALMADKERLLKGIIGKLISYALGRDTTIADRPYIDTVYQISEARDYSLRAAIEAIVAHPEFGRK